MNDAGSRRIVIAGGTGFLGTSLARVLVERGDDVVVLGRSEPKGSAAGRFVRWDARTTEGWGELVDGADAVVNLAGRTVDCIKSPDHCDEILRSRVEATLAVGRAVRSARVPPRVWVQMSTAHIYGDPPEVVCDEESAFGYGLAPIVGKAWEAAYAETKPEGVRGVVLRTSFVLGHGGGAMRRLSKLARLGLGGRIASGKQGMSWIHEADMNGLFVRAIDDESMHGAYIATAPNPVSNAEFMRELRRAVGMPVGLPAPAFGVRLAAPLLLRTDPELALYGRYCVPRRLQEHGFEFRYPTIREAMADLYRRR
ncbi:MAG: TIGR01777 family protein [Phycisphaeraceae bacterium]|nr:MAG: TIGR01777 family protein [Phycisphaeraceae bacterium]